jgi:outer membrane protein assembly factor BamB
MTALKQMLAVTVVLVGALAAIHAANWPQFRGLNGSGIGDGPEPPMSFGPSSNVLWQTQLARGHSSPCIWGDRIFLTTCEPPNLVTLCLDRASGKILWRQPVTAPKLESTHRLGSPAASTTATDGERVYVYFGSLGLLAYDFAGKELWRVPMAIPMVEFGTGASPIVVNDRVILICDQDLNAFLLAIDSRTGQTAWRVERPQFRRSFATPFVWRHDGLEELIVQGSIWLKAYNLKDGSERWTYSGTARVACSSPTASATMLYSASWNIGGDEGAKFTMPSFDEFLREHDQNKDGKLSIDEIPVPTIRDRFSQMDLNKDGLATREEWQNMAEMFAKAENAVLAIRPGGKGDITATHLAWKATRSLPYAPSPLCYKGRVYTVKSGGFASCYDASTGNALYQDARLEAGGDYYASIVAANGRIYLVSQQGVVTVLAAGDDLKPLAKISLGEEVFATPAIIEGTIYLRTVKRLYAFGSR